MRQIEMNSNHVNFFRQLIKEHPDNLNDGIVTVKFQRKMNIVVTIKNVDNGDRKHNIIPEKGIIEIEFGDKEKEGFFCENSQVFVDAIVMIIKELEKISSRN